MRAVRPCAYAQDDNDVIGLTGKGMSVDALIQELHLALDANEIRHAYLALIPRVLPGVGHGFYVKGSVADTSMSAGSLGVAFMRAYERVGRPDDPVLQIMLQTGGVTTDADVPPMRWRTCASHHVLATVGANHTIKAPISVRGRFVGTLNVARDTSDVTAQEKRRAMLIAAHLGTAFARAERFQQATAGWVAPPTPPHPALSERERQVAQFVGQGYSNAEIAEHGGISVNTVKEHLKRMYAKLGIHSRAELVQTMRDVK